MTKTITVTQDDIDRGERCDVHSCPVSRAVSRAFDGEWVSSWSTIDVFLGDKILEAKAPEEAFNFIQRFDVGIPVEPFSFEAEFVERILENDLRP